jgi:hypothetical protein
MQPSTILPVLWTSGTHILLRHFGAGASARARISSRLALRGPPPSRRKSLRWKCPTASPEALKAGKMLLAPLPECASTPPRMTGQRGHTERAKMQHH